MMGPRVGAGTYLLTMSSVVCLWCLVAITVHQYGLTPGRMTLDTAGYIIWGLGIGVGVIFTYVSKRRLQDLNCPPMWASLMALPLFGIVLLPALCFLSPVRISNRFGRPPLPSGKLKVAAALTCFVLALVLVQTVAHLYAPLHMRSPF